MHMNDAPIFTFTHPALGERTFTLRTVIGPRAKAFCFDTIPAFEAYDEMPCVTLDDIRARARRLIELFFGTDAQANETMRMALAGDHTGIDWAYDMETDPMFDVITAWMRYVKDVYAPDMLARAEADGVPLDAPVKRPARKAPPAKKTAKKTPATRTARPRKG